MNSIRAMQAKIKLAKLIESLGCDPVIDYSLVENEIQFEIDGMIKTYDRDDWRRLDGGSVLYNLIDRLAPYAEIKDAIIADRLNSDLDKWIRYAQSKWVDSLIENGFRGELADHEEILL